MTQGNYLNWGKGGPYDEEEFVNVCPIHRVELLLSGACLECLKAAEAVNEEDEE